MNMLPVLNTDALFSDLSENYVTPMEPDAGDEVTVRVRTARANVDEVWLVSGERKLRMHLEKTQGVFDYYKTSFVMPDQIFLYYFEI